MSLSRDNTMLASGSLDKTVRVWCTQSSAAVAVLTGHSGHITSVQFSPCVSRGWEVGGGGEGGWEVGGEGGEGVREGGREGGR